MASRVTNCWLPIRTVRGVIDMTDFSELPPFPNFKFPE